MGVTFAEQSDPAVRRFFSSKLDCNRLPDTALFLSFKDEQGVLGGWVFERYTGPRGSVVAHWAGRDRNWLTRGMLRIAGAYIFHQLDCSQVLGEVKSGDIYVRRIDERLGFKETATIPGYFPDDDLVIYSMRREDCRWI